MATSSVGTASGITVRSSAFEVDQPIPVQHTGDGKDTSPPLQWTGVPDAAQELVLICDDPDAPTPEPWVHWVLHKVSADTAGLPGGLPTSSQVALPPGARQGKNSWGITGYRGPAPPRRHGVHYYHFKLYALDAALDLPAGLDKKALLGAMAGHVLAEGELVGTYQR